MSIPVLVEVIIKRNREHDSKCFVDAWNVVGDDSDNSRCDWSSRLARSVKNDNPVQNRKKKPDKQLAVIELGYRRNRDLVVGSGSVSWQNGRL